MTKQEFMEKLTRELENRQVADAEDVLEEYRQHFEFKLADGYSQEEIAAKLGDPAALAAQFETAEGVQPHGNKPLAVVGLCFADLFGGMIYLVMAAWEAVMGAGALAGAGAAVCLLFGLNPYSLIPTMPYWCGVLLALALAALSVLMAVGCVYYGAFLRQLARAFGRFQRNTLAAASGRAVLPSLSVAPRFSAKINRRLRRVGLVSLAAFGVCLVLSYAACSLSAGAFEFWHAWGWFQ